MVGRRFKRLQGKPQIKMTTLIGPDERLFQVVRSPLERFQFYLGTKRTNEPVTLAIALPTTTAFHGHQSNLIFWFSCHNETQTTRDRGINLEVNLVHLFA